MDGGKFVRIEIDHNEDGRIDRWEYYGPDGKLENVGISRSNDGKNDAWLYRDSGGSLERMEIATKRDGRPNRVEFYTSGKMTRAEEDTDGDRRVDRWETYRGDVLAAVAFDTMKSGKPTITVNYGLPRR